MNEGSLGIHQIELVIKSCPCFSDGCRIRQHAHGSLYLSKISSGNNSWRLVIDSNLESSWAPVNELDGSLGFDGSNGCVDILGNNISSVQKAAGHVLSMPWVTLNHLVCRLEARVGDLRYSQLFMVSLLSRDDWSISNEGEVNPGVGNQIGLELSQINIKGSIESQRSSDRRDDLSDQSVEVGIRGSLDIQVSSTDIINGFIVNHESTV